MSVRCQFDPPPCPEHDDPGCECDVHLALTMTLVRLAAADDDLDRFVEQLPDHYRRQELAALGPVTASTFERMRQAADEVFVLRRALEDMPGMGPPSAGCWHMQATPAQPGVWAAAQPGVWLCLQCAAHRSKPMTCDGCADPLTEAPTTSWFTIASQWRPGTTDVAPPLLVLLAMCQRCNADDLDHLDDPEATR